jgi:hypothetical protein
VSPVVRMAPNFGGIRPRKPIDGCGMAPLPAEDGKTSSCDPAISCDSAILAYDEAEERNRNRDRIVGMLRGGRPLSRVA